jgi:hypothetical protein
MEPIKKLSDQKSNLAKFLTQINLKLPHNIY